MHLMEIHSIFVFVNLMPFKSSLPVAAVALSEQCFFFSKFHHRFIHEILWATFLSSSSSNSDTQSLTLRNSLSPSSSLLAFFLLSSHVNHKTEVVEKKTERKKRKLPNVCILLFLFAFFVVFLLFVYSFYMLLCV